MPKERSSGTQVCQIGVETVENTAVAALKRFTSLMIEFGINVNRNRHKAAGYRRPTVMTTGKKWTAISGSGPVSFTELIYILSGLYKSVTPTTPGGGTNSRDWTYEQSSTLVETIPTFTIEKGSPEGCERAAGCFWTGWGMTFDSDAVNLSLEGLGRSLTDSVALSTGETETIDLSGADDPTGGTWTITVLGKTTAAIDWDATAAEVQTALRALDASGAEYITVTKAGFVYTLVFPAFLGNVTEATVNSGSLTTGGSISVTIATTVPGVAATELTQRPCTSEMLAVYVDSTSGALGTTKLTRVLSGSISDSAMRDALYTVDSGNSGSMAAKVDGAEPTGTLTLKVECDAAGMAFYNSADVGGEYFIRLEAIDEADAIEAGFTYEFDFDFAAEVESFSAFENDQGVYSYTVTFAIKHSTSWSGKAMSLRVRNASTAL